MPPRIAVVVGTRPEVIKMAPVYRALVDSGRFEPLLVSTGQHREMSKQAFEALEIEPNVELDLMTHAQSLGDFSARSIAGLTRCFEQNKPDVVLVHGDTTTTFAASLAAFYLRIKVGHVEAGMRTGDVHSPWPEEINRRLTAPLCHWHFVPMVRNQQNLEKEGIPADRCFLTGNTVIDALLWMRENLSTKPSDPLQTRERLNIPEAFFDQFLNSTNGRMLLVTGHRRESHGEGIENLCSAILELIHRFPDLGVLYPVHLNPSVKDAVQSRLSNHDRIALTAPMDYRDFVWAMERSFAIVSDSGGIQGEAMSLHKPLLVTRTITEYPEALESGGCLLVGTQTSRIVDAATGLLTNPDEYIQRCQARNPYGDGHAAAKIVAILSSEMGCLSQ